MRIILRCDKIRKAAVVFGKAKEIRQNIRRPDDACKTAGTAELKKGIASIVAIHLKETRPVTAESSGEFRGVPLGAGTVDFAGAFGTFPARNVVGDRTRRPCGDRAFAGVA